MKTPKLNLLLALILATQFVTTSQLTLQRQEYNARNLISTCRSTSGTSLIAITNESQSVRGFTGNLIEIPPSLEDVIHKTDDGRYYQLHVVHRDIPAWETHWGHGNDIRFPAQKKGDIHTNWVNEGGSWPVRTFRLTSPINIDQN